MNRIRSKITANLRLPQDTLFGFIAKQRMIKNNKHLEENAARLCQIMPHHRVLEVGFGPGIGIGTALKYIQDGPGKIYGMELSTYMLKSCWKKFKKEISEGKLELEQGSIVDLPYSSDSFDRVFHCNTFYFVKNLPLACAEMHRVLKPESMMVTTLNLDRLKVIESELRTVEGDVNPLKYMVCLESVGFKDVKIEYLEDNGKPYQVIYAHVGNKLRFVEEQHVGTL